MRKVLSMLGFASYLCVLWLRLVIDPAAVVMADASMRQVASSAELKQAIVAGESNIVFVNNITLDEATFPGAHRCNATRRRYTCKVPRHALAEMKA